MPLKAPQPRNNPLAKVYNNGRELLTRMQYAAAEGANVDTELDVVVQEDSRRSCSVMPYRLLTNQKNPEAASAHFFDITERKRIEEQERS